MSKIEFNPRKKQHIDFMHTIIMDLHNEIFNMSLAVVRKEIPKKELETKIILYKKYSRRLKILEL